MSKSRPKPPETPFYNLAFLPIEHPLVRDALSDLDLSKGGIRFNAPPTLSLMPLSVTKRRTYHGFKRGL